MCQDAAKSHDFHRNLENSVESEGHMNAWDIKREAAIPMWQARIKACRSSELTVKEWCEANGIDRRTYYKWESLCLARASQCATSGTEMLAEKRSMIQINPASLPTTVEEPNEPVSIATAELVIRCGCVSMDISPQMSVTKIAELVSALNSHV